MADHKATRAAEGQERGAQAILRLAAFRLPILTNDQQLALARAVVARRTYGVHPLLDRWDELHVLVNGNMQGGELGDVIGVSVGLRLAVLELLGLSLQRQLRDLDLLDDILRERHELLEELPRRLAEQVKVLSEELLHRGQHDGTVLVLRGNLLHRHHLERVEAHLLQEQLNTLGVIDRIHGQGLAIRAIHKVLNARALDVHLDMEGRAVVIRWREPVPVGDLQQLTFTNVGPGHELRLVLLLEGDVLPELAVLLQGRCPGLGVKLRRDLADILLHSQRLSLLHPRSVIPMLVGCKPSAIGTNVQVGDLNALRQDKQANRPACKGCDLRSPVRELLTEAAHRALGRGGN
mmetsp:Transcript_42070/g.121549  ORF Transcript_42070/g.121549 Transcript_42070/m.121549 type:complete len:349 (+) Transcript_42070:602-1648(+)